MPDDIQGPIPTIEISTEQLRLFAFEAEVNENFEMAAVYYEERLVREPQNLDHWLDYGAFCLLIEDNIKAQECFRKALSLNENHIHSLLLCGVMAVMMENYEQAEIFFEDATCLEPTNVIAWTLLGLFYEIQNNDIRMEMAFHEAFKQLQARHVQTKLKKTATIENIDEELKIEPHFGSWAAIHESITAMKAEGIPAGTHRFQMRWMELELQTIGCWQLDQTQELPVDECSPQYRAAPPTPRAKHCAVQSRGAY